MTGRRALVVFSGEAHLFWLRLLRPGFRHCFLALESHGRWITYDPMLHRTALALLSVPASFDLAGWYRVRGLTVVVTRVPPLPAQPRPMPWGPFTCVEAIKRILGIRDRRIVTPWRLYRRLARIRPSI